MIKMLVIIVGHNYLNPLEVIGNYDYIIKNLTNESNNNNYIYCLYTHNDKFDCYISYGVIYQGFFSEKEGNRIDGIRIAR